MLQISKIRENKDLIIDRLAVKNFDAKQAIEAILEIDSKRRKTQNELDAVLNESNGIAKQVGELFKSGKQAEANELKAKTVVLKENSKKLEEELALLEAEQHTLLVQLPNTPSILVPKGKTPADNETV